MPSLEIHQIPYGSDNYCFLVHDRASNQTACVDAGDSEVVLQALKAKDLSLNQLWITHHHGDHTAGLLKVKETTGCKVYGPLQLSSPIAGLDEKLGDGDQFKFGEHIVDILHTPGHTTDMINFHIASEKLVFTGDTLFVMGCGRLFEGDGQMMWNSLEKLMALDRETEVHCAHEYTLANANFALSIEPENNALQHRHKEVVALREAGKSTVPTTLAKELETNPFLRPGSIEIRTRLGMENASNAEVFTEVRRLKDQG